MHVGIAIGCWWLGWRHCGLERPAVGSLFDEFLAFGCELREYSLSLRRPAHMLRHCVLERAVYELPSLDDTIGQHPLAIPMKLRMTIESARLVRPFFHAHLQALAALPLDKSTVDPFAQTALSRLRSNSRPLVQIPVPRASAQIANEFAAAVSLCRRDDPP